MAEVLENQVKFGWLTRSGLNISIEREILSAYSICFTRDTNQCFIIDENLNPVSIKSRVEVYSSIQEANEKLNQRTSTYAGEIVSIVDGDYYKAYSVQVDSDDNFFVKAIHDPNDFNQLVNRPMDTLNGTTENPIVVTDLDDGNYMVRGVFFKPLSSTSSTSLLGNQFSIETVGEVKYITQITATDIFKYKIGEQSSTEKYITDAYVSEREQIYDQTYVKSENLDEEVAAYEYIKKEYLELQLQNLQADIQEEIDDIQTQIDTLSSTIEEEIDEVKESIEDLRATILDTVDEEVGKALDEKLKPLTKEEIDDAWDGETDIPIYM